MTTAPDRGSTASANSIFEQPWWLNSVAPGTWDEAVVQRGGQVAARLPYVRRRRLGLTTLVQPAYTQTLGPWLAPSRAKYARRLQDEKHLLTQLIERLPPFDFFRQCFSPTATNWLPFFWAGFEATVRYTYRLEDLSDLDRVRSEFQDHVRRDIRRAQGAAEIDSGHSIDELLALDAGTFRRQGLPPPASHDALRRLDAACGARGTRRIFSAVDAAGQTCAALLVVWDERTMYALVNARDPECYVDGANTLLFWEAIRFASQVSQVFDFEGSMLEPVEHYFRGFGARQVPYFCVWKAGLRAKLALAARSAGPALARAGRRRG